MLLPQALQQPPPVTRSQLRPQQLCQQRQRQSSWSRTTCLHRQRPSGRPAAVGRRHAAAAAAWLRLSETASSVRWAPGTQCLFTCTNAGCRPMRLSGVIPIAPCVTLPMQEACKPGSPQCRASSRHSTVSMVLNAQLSEPLGPAAPALVPQVQRQMAARKLTISAYTVAADSAIRGSLGVPAMTEFLCNTGRPVDPEFAAVARRTREEHEARHLSKLVDPSDLPQRSVFLQHVARPVLLQHALVCSAAPQPLHPDVEADTSDCVSAGNEAHGAWTRASGVHRRRGTSGASRRSGGRAHCRAGRPASGCARLALPPGAALATQYGSLQLALWQRRIDAVDQYATGMPSALHREDDIGGSGSDSDTASDEEPEDVEVAEEEDYADLTGTRPPNPVLIRRMIWTRLSCCKSAWPGCLSTSSQF